MFPWDTVIDEDCCINVGWVGGKEKILLALARTETGNYLGVTVRAEGVGENSFQLEQLQ